VLTYSPDARELVEKTSFDLIAGSIEESIVDDVAFLKKSPFIDPKTQVIGLLWDINTGKLREIA